MTCVVTAAELGEEMVFAHGEAIVALKPAGWDCAGALFSTEAEADAALALIKEGK